MDQRDRLALRKAAAFWRRVDRSGSCWIWKGATDRKGYGRYQADGQKWIASRYAWTLVNGTIAPTLMVCHDCDTPSCVRPTHLRAGTAQDNYYDMVRKGRHDRTAHPFEMVSQPNRMCWFDCGRYLPDPYPARWYACPECRANRKGEVRAKGHTANCQLVRHAGEGGEVCNCGRKVPVPSQTATEAFVTLEPSAKGTIVVCGVLVRAGSRVRYWGSLADGDGREHGRNLVEAFCQKLDELPVDAQIFHYSSNEYERLQRTLPESPYTGSLTERFCSVSPMVKQHLSASGSLRRVAKTLGLGLGTELKGAIVTGELWRVWNDRPTEKAYRALRKYNSDDLKMLMALVDCLRRSVIA